MAELREFISRISVHGIARKSRYKVKVHGPAGISMPRNMDMMCESISFPGQNIRSVPDTLRYGPPREHGQGMTYGPFTATFICSPNLIEKDYFEAWQSEIINQGTWEAKYYDTYKGWLEITQLDIDNRPTYRIRVEEAYPKTIMPQDMGHAQSNAYQTIGIEFTYRYWRPARVPMTSRWDRDADEFVDAHPIYGEMDEGTLDANAGTRRAPKRWPNTPPPGFRAKPLDTLIRPEHELDRLARRAPTGPRPGIQFLDY